MKKVTKRKNVERGLCFNSVKDVVRYIKRTPYDKETMRIDLMAAYLIVARESDDFETLDKIAWDMVQENVTIRYLESFINRNYGRYGIDELIPVYERLEMKDCYKPILLGTHEEIKKMEWSYVMGSLSGEVSYSANSFINHYLSLRIRNIYKNWIVEMAHTEYPELTKKILRTYVSLRKKSNYKISFATWTNEDILIFCKKNKIKLSWNQLQHYRRVFNYEEDSEDGVSYEVLPLRKRKEYKMLSPMCQLNIARFKLDKITESEVQNDLRLIRNVLNLNEEDVSVLRTWSYRARYEGIIDSNNLVATDSLRRRYFIEYRSNEDRDIINRLRGDIRSAMRNGKLPETKLILALSRSTIRGDYSSNVA